MAQESLPEKSPSKKAKKNAHPEKQIQNAILHWLNMQPSVAYAWQNDSVPVVSIMKRGPGGTIFGRFRKRKTIFRPNGLSDVLGFLTRPYGGKFIAIEVKSATGRATAEQVQFINAVIQAGGVAGICRSIEDVETLFRENGIMK